MAFRLFTTYFDSGRAERQHELAFALAANCDAFDSVMVVSQGCLQIEAAGPNCQWILQGERQAFRQLLELANLASPGDVVVIANSDVIVQGATLRKMAATIQVNEVYALSRWDMLARGLMLFDRHDSQDCWVFRGPPKQNIGGDYPFGFPGVDNRFAHELSGAGYVVLNPSHDIRSYHCHLSQYRLSNEARNRVPLPYLLVAPHKLGEQPRYTRPFRLSRRAGHFQT